jgi:hypothetical protein
LHIERFLGEHDNSRLHSGIIENIDSTVRSRYLAPIQDLCSFLLQRALQASESEGIPSLEPLQIETSKDLESSIGFWMARSLIGSEPKLDHELQFASRVGELVYSDNARFVASLFLSNEKRIDYV